jgi:hypothetical protein
MRLQRDAAAVFMFPFRSIAHKRPGAPAMSALRAPQNAQLRPATACAVARAEPFRNAEQAWFWTIAALTARRDGASNTGTLVNRPCDPDDVLKCLDGLYRRRRIDLLHARILRIWGERQTAPDPTYATDRADAAIWREALERLEWPLRVKGIVS